MGVWLPLALADVVSSLLSLVRMWSSAPANVQPPTRADLLARWVLPMMSRSLAAEDEERKARELLESVKRLKRKVEGK